MREGASLSKRPVPSAGVLPVRRDMWRQGLCHEKLGRVSEAPLARGFMRLINVLHTKAPQAKFALRRSD
jgi:hypothetical protein